MSILTTIMVILAIPATMAMVETTHIRVIIHMAVTIDTGLVHIAIITPLTLVITLLSLVITTLIITGTIPTTMDKYKEYLYILNELKLLL